MITTTELLGPVLPWFLHRHIDIDRECDYELTALFDKDRWPYTPRCDRIIAVWNRDVGGATVAMVDIDKMPSWAIEIAIAECKL